jgi:tetrahydromethanopterin S-methyltransferase subunit A
MRIRGCKSAVPYLCNLSLEAIERFQKQVEVIDHVDSTDIREAPNETLARYDFDAGMLDQIHRSILECEARDPGPFPAPPCIESNEALRLEGENAARITHRPMFTPEDAAHAQ